MSNSAPSLARVRFLASMAMFALLEATAMASTTSQPIHESNNVSMCDVVEELIHVHKELIVLREALNQTDRRVSDISTGMLNVSCRADEAVSSLVTGDDNNVEKSDYGLSMIVKQAARAVPTAESGVHFSAFRRSLKAMQQINTFQSPGFFSLSSEKMYEDCQDAFIRGQVANGVYTISRGGRPPFRVWCDFDSNGGWAVIQRRFDGSIGFSRSREEYVRGFGSLWGEHWLGLDAMRLLARSGVRLSVYLEDYTHQYYWANYSNFHIADADDHYRLHVSGFSGNVLDSLAVHNGSQFSTWDSDRDSSHRNCAADYYGGWWYAGCYTANLNGRYDAAGNSTATTLWRVPPYTRMVASVMRISSQR